MLDGELVCLQPLENGRVCCRFDRLSAFMLGASPQRRASNGLSVVLIAFDAVAAGGSDLRREHWRERRAELKQLLAGADGVLRITPILEATAEVHEALVADGWEGTVAKRVTGRYRCGRRSTDWVKLKSPGAIARDRARVEMTLRRRAVHDQAFGGARR